MTKNFRFGLAVSAAMLTLGVAELYGQDSAVSAEIPFAFSINGSNMLAGNYQFEWLSHAHKVMRLQNVETGKTEFVSIRNPVESKGNRPQLVFYCASHVCSLAELSFGAGNGWEFDQQRSVHGDRGHLATIYLNQNGHKAIRNSQ